MNLLTTRHLSTIWMGGIAAVTAMTWGVGCASSDSNRQVEHTSVSFEMYDSPLVASKVHTTSPTSGPVPERESSSTRADAPPEPDEEREATEEASYEDAPQFGAVSPSAEEPTEGVEPNPDAARYVHAVYRANRIELPEDARTDISELYRTCRKRDAISMSGPAAGDIVFFHNTTDANGDGRNNDWYSYVAIVERPHGGERPELIGYREGGLKSFRMNRRQPASSKANTRLRIPSSDDPPFTRYRAGELFAGYCSLLGDRDAFILVEDWRPGMTIEPPSSN